MMVNMVSFRLTVSTYYSSVQILSSYIVPNKTQENRRSPFLSTFSLLCIVVCTVTPLTVQVHGLFGRGKLAQEVVFTGHSPRGERDYDLFIILSSYGDTFRM